MENNNQASFEVDIRNGIIRVSGPVTFVEEQITTIRKDINLVQAITDYKPPVEVLQHTSAEVVNAAASGKSIAKYENAISVDPASGKVHLLTTFTQVSKATATMEIALIYCWAKKQLGIETVSSKEVRDVCQDHGVLDPANFASHLDKHKSYFIIDKSTGNYTIRLTNPGLKQAELILEKYNQN